MDEEEKLKNSLIGQEEAPSVNMGDSLMGAGQPMFNLNSNVVAAVPGIENIRNPGAFDPESIEPVEPVGPPTTVGESISQTYNESVLADLINRGFGQEAFQSQALDGTPTYSIYNKRFGTLGSQVPYSEASPEAKAQAMKFMLGTGGQERPLPETPTSPVRTPEQVQSILDEQRVTQAPPVESALGETSSVTPPVENLAAVTQGPAQAPELNPTSDEAILARRAAREAEFLNAQPTAPRSDLFPNDPGVQRTRDELMRRFGAPTIREIQEQDAIRAGRMTQQQMRDAYNTAGRQAGTNLTPPPLRDFAPQAPSGQVRDALFRGPPQQGAEPAFSTGPNIDPGITRERPSNIDPGFIQQPSLRDPDAGFIRPAPNLSDFEREGRAREARLDARPDFNAAISDRDRRAARGEGLSQADLRDLAQGMDPNASEGQRMRSLEIQQRAGLGQFKPEKELTDLEKREIESRIRGTEADIAASEIKGGFEPRVIDVGGERAMELSPGYFQRIAKDKPNKTGLQTTLENLQSDLDSGRLTQEQYDIAAGNARNLYIGLKPPKETEIDVQDRIDEIREGKMGATLPEEADASEIKSYATEAEARASGVKGEVLIGGRRAVIE